MKILLVDGTNVVMRYAFAMLPDILADRTRKATDADIEKVMKAVDHAIRECAKVAGCTHAIICLDSVGELWRKAVYPDYKKNRNTITAPWVNMLHTWFTAKGWLVLRYPTQEADDLLATLATRIQAAGKSCAVLSGDSDLLALVSPTCNVFQFGRNQEPRYVERDRRAVEIKYGVTPELLRFYKALVGETGDGIPGVRGVGEKKAAKLLKMATYDHGLLRGLLPTHSGSAVEEFDQMLALVTLNTKVPLDQIAPSQCVIPETP